MLNSHFLILCLSHTLIIQSKIAKTPMPHLRRSVQKHSNKEYLFDIFQNTAVRQGTHPEPAKDQVSSSCDLKFQSFIFKECSYHKLDSLNLLHNFVISYYSASFIKLLRSFLALLHRISSKHH